MDEKFREGEWEFKTSLSGKEFDDFDFSKTDFNHPIFNGVVFKNCLFDRSNLTDARAYGCIFQNCLFRQLDLRTLTIGAKGGAFKDCRFERCDFRKGRFYYPEFFGCIFTDCKWKGVDFSASCFEDCKFVGKLQDVIFRGRYKDDLTEGAKPNTMKGVDFSDAELGEYVAFDNCDLSLAVPPRGKTFSSLLKVSEFRKGNYLITFAD